MSHYAIHAPFEANERFEVTTPDCELPALQQTYATMISMDESLGQIMDFVDTRNIADNTIILFMSDNGQAPSAPANKPLRGHKLNAYEGGIRVPFIAHWPGVTKPGTINSSDYLIIEDIFPSILELAGMPVNDIPTMGIDGKSFVPMLQGETEVRHSIPILALPQHLFCSAI
ncbi:MAG: sulfatase-like hydrolase/transferase [Pirellulaceae bacterium]